MVWSEIEGWKRAKQLRAILIGFSLFTVLVVGANIAMAVTVAGKATLCPAVEKNNILPQVPDLTVSLVRSFVEGDQCGRQWNYDYEGGQGLRCHWTGCNIS